MTRDGYPINNLNKRSYSTLSNPSRVTVGKYLNRDLIYNKTYCFKVNKLEK